MTPTAVKERPQLTNGMLTVYTAANHHYHCGHSFNTERALRSICGRPVTFGDTGMARVPAL